jgi:hypothetical protein
MTVLCTRMAAAVTLIGLAGALPTDFVVGQQVQTSSGPVTGHGASGAPEVSEYLGIPFVRYIHNCY